MVELVDMVLLAFMAVVAVIVVRLRNLFSVVLVSGFFSLLSASMFVVLDAVDVAFTEAAVGAGVATVIMLGTLLLTTSEEKKASGSSLGALLVVLITGAILVYGTLDMPRYGDPDAPIHHHVAPRYTHDSPREIGVPNIVTSVLASYRGYDTLGETTVIFTAGLGLLLLIGSSLRARGKKEDGC
jgi:multicomponent Na+:H+ antiporter subunit B